MSANGPLKKYQVAFVFEAYAETHGQAYANVLRLLPRMVHRHETLEISRKLDLDDQLPTGGIDGEAHSAEGLTGWSCLYTVREAT
jgi:hypothetical protein